MQNEYAYSAAFNFSKYDSSSEDEAKPKHTRKRSRRCFEPTSSASLAAPTFHELHSVETSSSSIDLDFIIYGHLCMLHEDRNGFAKELISEENLIDLLLDTGYCDHKITYAATTASSDEENHMNINNDCNSRHLYVDKYDVRTLMTREDLLLLNEDTYRKNEEWDDDLTLEERKELDELRFGDMYISASSMRHRENNGSKDKVVRRDSQKTDLSDGNIETSTVQTKNELSIATASDEKDEENNCNSIFELEASIRSIIPADTPIPSSKRQFDIIQMTAKKSCDQPQFELFLKVKEETNPDFGFLSQKNELYPFYLALKISFEAKINNEENVQRQKAIGLLDMYSSSSSDEENEQESHSDDKVNKEEVSAIAQSNTENSNELSKEEKRAMRLKKAKLLRHRFEQP